MSDIILYNGSVMRTGLFNIGFYFPKRIRRIEPKLTATNKGIFNRSCVLIAFIYGGTTKYDTNDCIFPHKIIQIFGGWQTVKSYRFMSPDEPENYLLEI